MTITPSKINNRDPEYMYVHRWVSRHYGPANHCTNDENHVGPTFQWANVTGIYERNIEHFRQLCRSCHAKFDMSDYSREVSRRKLQGNTLRRKSVRQVDNNGRVIKEYPSLTHASQEIGVVRTAISNCLRGRTKSAGGYRWEVVL